jgi:23S rRNA G2445 N2-methylase RlmL
VISKKRFVVFNPPYNERLKTDLTLGQMVSQAAKKYQPDRMAVLGSVSQWKERIQIPDMKLQQILDFENGGLPVRCGFFDRIAIRGPAIE